MGKTFFFATLALAAICAFENHLAELRTDIAEDNLTYLSQFDAQPKADRIRISKAVMKAREAKKP